MLAPPVPQGRPAPVDIPQGRLLLNDILFFLQGCRQALSHRETLAGQLDAGLEEASPGQPPMSLVRQLIATNLTRNCHRQPACGGRGTQLVAPDKGQQGLSQAASQAQGPRGTSEAMEGDGFLRSYLDSAEKSADWPGMSV